MLIKRVLPVVLLAGLLASYSSGQFYYGSDGPIPLTVDSTKVTIKFDQTFSPGAQQALLESIDRIIAALDDDHMIDGFQACALSNGQGYDAFLDSLDTISGIYLVEPYYFSEIDSPLVVGDGFCVAFDLGLTSSEIDSINVEFGAVMDHRWPTPGFAGVGS